MTDSNSDSDQVKAGQRQGWDNVAQGWREWWTTFERDFQPISDRMIELAQIQPGGRVLDIATGTGEPGVTAAKMVGPTGRVVGIDQATQMLEIARERATALGLQNIEFRDMDAEQLEFPDESFEAVLSRLGLMFLPNLIPALEGMRQKLVPSGRMVAAVFGPPPNAPFPALALQVASQQLQIPPPPPVPPNLFSLSAPGLLEQKFRDAGFNEVRGESMIVDFNFATPKDYTRFQYAIAAPLRAIVAKASLEQQSQIEQAITEAVRRYLTPDGSVKIPAELICVVGHR